VDVIDDAARLKDMLAYSKQERRIPVIVDGGQVTIGFDGGS
jgi:arsenate reductase-like glutaredoxin family protein